MLANLPCKNLLSYLIAIVVVVVLFGDAGTMGAELSFNRITRRWGVAEFQVADVDGDGTNEFIALSDNHYFWLINEIVRPNFLGPTIADVRDSNWITHIVAIDIDSTAGTEIAVMKKDIDGDSVWLEILTFAGPQRKVLCRTEAIQGKDIRSKFNNPAFTSWDGVLDSCLAVDLDNDGSKELVVLVNTGFDCYPRGIYAYDYPSGDLLWYFATAGPPADLYPRDVNNDGLPELLFLTIRPGNNCQAGGMTDTVSYVIAIDNQGKLIWKESLNDPFGRAKSSNIVVGDCDNDDIIEVYYTKVVEPNQYEQQLYLLQKRTAYGNQLLAQKVFDAKNRVVRILCADLNGDNKKELIVDNPIQILGGDSLEIQHASSITRYQPILVGNIYGENNSPPEIVLSYEDTLLVLDNELNPLAAFATDHGELIVNRRVKLVQNPYGGYYLVLIAFSTVAGQRNHSLYISSIVPTKAFGLMTPVTAFLQKRWYGLFLVFVAGLIAGMGIRRFATRLRQHGKESGRGLTSDTETFSPPMSPGTLKAQSEAALPPGTVIMSKYKIIRLHSRGGMGEVYLAQDIRLERLVALKFLSEERINDAKWRVRFEREAKATAALNHPNIVTVYEIDEYENRPFIAMEYIDGMSLAKLIKNHLTPLATIRDIVLQACDGLSAAHAVEIIHRDIKPSNILIDKQRVVKIADFGLAMLPDNVRMTSTGTRAGTPAYMSPEQIAGRTVDHRTDIYSLGVVIYELLTRQLPYSTTTPAELGWVILHREPIPLSSVLGGRHENLQQIIDKCLAKEPEARYTDVYELRGDVSTKFVLE
jgi:predicted Ser/Thr protein kinase